MHKGEQPVQAPKNKNRAPVERKRVNFCQPENGQLQPKSNSTCDVTTGSPFGVEQEFGSTTVGSFIVLRASTNQTSLSDVFVSISRNSVLLIGLNKHLYKSDNTNGQRQLRLISLLAEVDPNGTTALIVDGELVIVLPLLDQR